MLSSWDFLGFSIVILVALEEYFLMKRKFEEWKEDR